MTTPSTILVTGATGHLGTAVCQALRLHGFEVRATDKRFLPDFVAPLTLGDLLDELFVYRVLEGCDAVVHLGNHPNALAGPSPQRLLAENVTMNSNVFVAATQLGIRILVFSSSVQAMLRSMGGRREMPFRLPYLPLDGQAPADPGVNTYALSKEFAERHLQQLCGEYPELSATALRFPMLPRENWIRHLTSTPQPLPGFLNFGECLTHLLLPDAGRLVVKVLEKRLPGYHQYFPAQAMHVKNASADELRQRFFAHVPLRVPASEFTEFVDLSALSEDLGWAPSERVSIEAKWVD